MLKGKLPKLCNPTLNQRLVTVSIRLSHCFPLSHLFRVPLQSKLTKIMVSRYWLPEFQVTDGRETGYVTGEGPTAGRDRTLGLRYCRLCFNVGADNLVTHLPWKAMARDGQCGIPEKKDGLINLLL